MGGDTGERRGDLGKQGRLTATVTTADPVGHIPNVPSAWGGIYRNGYLYIPDTNSGLWIVQLEPKKPPTAYVPDANGEPWHGSSRRTWR